MMVKANSQIDTSNTRPLRDFSVLTFRLAGQTYGLPVTVAIQIIDMVTITQLPQAPPAIQGIINVRGEIVPVMDLRLRFGLDFQPYRLYTPIILTEFHGQTLGLVVDSVETVMEVPQIDLEATEFIIPPELAEALGVFTPNGHLSGVSRTANHIILILDAETLLSHDELARLMKVLLSREPEGVPA
jgi:purine-binding chemotaxis protein CheW